MKSPAAIIITPVDNVYIAVPLTEGQLKEWWAGKDVIDEQTKCIAHRPPVGFELSNILIDIKAGGKIFFTDIEHT